MSRSLGKEAARQSGGKIAHTSVSFVRWQRGEQTVAGVGIQSNLWALCEKSHFTKIPDVFNVILQRVLSVLLIPQSLLVQLPVYMISHRNMTSDCAPAQFILVKLMHCRWLNV